MRFSLDLHSGLIVSKELVFDVTLFGIRAVGLINAIGCDYILDCREFLEDDCATGGVRDVACQRKCHAQAQCKGESFRYQPGYILLYAVFPRFLRFLAAVAPTEYFL